MDNEEEYVDDEDQDIEYVLEDEPAETDPTLSSRGVTIQDILGALFEMQGSVPGVSDGISNDVIRLFTSNPRRNVAAQVDDEEEESDDDSEYLYRRRRARHRHRRPVRFTPAEKPEEAGLELLYSGQFGSTHLKKKRNIAHSILDRSRARPRVLAKEELSSTLVPNSNGTTVASYGANIYSAQFSADSSFFYTCAQDFKLHIYDITAGVGLPKRHGSLTTTMKVARSINGPSTSWTITDSHLDSNNERLIYCCMSDTVYMTNTREDSTAPDVAISFADDNNPRQRGSTWRDVYGSSYHIWSCRFSADGNEIVAGGSGQIFVYDLMANQRTVKIEAHDQDINSCCWADTQSGNILVSASDDTYIKIWDRRSLGSSQRPSGILPGHTEGITNVSSKGDGRYIISNGKDQACRLFDLRKMKSSADDLDMGYYGIPQFDYRDSSYPEPRYPAHPDDCSVMTYRGHSVLRTLIRCHFSPAETTGAQYIYSGSEDGRIHIWNLDGTIAQVLDRSKTLPMSSDPSGTEMADQRRGSANYTCVRDLSWHSQEPVMISAAWDGSSRYGGSSTLARHEWKGLSKYPGALEDWVEKKRLEDAERSSRQHVPGAFHDEPDEEEEEEE